MKSYTFIDLFAGIGGFHLALSSLGCNCVFASEIDVYARKTYEHNFYTKNKKLFDENNFNKDIRAISSYEIPDFDILCAGFPCQPFSQAGYKRGFNDIHKSERGNLFFYIADIIKDKKPKAFFLENVRGLSSHNNGKTIKVIRDILVNECGYSFYSKIVKASDYGLPQLRPRLFMIGFRDDNILNNFKFPPAYKTLDFNMSDVWGGKCSREIGFTLRVGGRGSGITDRRNWDSYLVDNKVRQLTSKQAKKMQGFPQNFSFPVSENIAMKQLGNSVAVNAVQECAFSLLKYLHRIDKFKPIGKKTMSEHKRNKGEWVELYTFIKLLNDKKIFLSDNKLNKLGIDDVFYVQKVTTHNLNKSYCISNEGNIYLKDKYSSKKQLISIKEFINQEVLSNLITLIKKGSGSFIIPEFEKIQDKLGISIINGGNSKQKADIVLDIHKDTTYHDQGFSIKSYLTSSLPTLLNASSSNTNFIYKVKNISIDKIDEINNINSTHKIIDRLKFIYDNGGSLHYYKTEKEVLSYNLSLIDTNMDKILGEMLLSFYVNRVNSVQKNIEYLYKKNIISHYSNEYNFFEIKIKNLLLAVLLGLFTGEKWNGEFIANGLIVVKKDGEPIAFHIIKADILKTFLLENVIFDTPSSSRHLFGKLYVEEDRNIYLKLNLQLRLRPFQALVS